ncbi:proline--tRNA ligase [Paenibacillus montanisoli]|uniref:Proline--tRNA ligase n=1 Tax=Paenibacillus montanisoli TaxID=2081970 RepID=A0A328U6P6_9BACL|nr:proline--tRNA ligase [Paenibacillus montanisoli]RAP78387.1 proline--tRNA ligase [Paenibacillus montanisoli]
MRQKSAFLPTMREVPADAEAISHKWLVKGGFIRQLSAGVYSFLPLGRRVLRKVEAIVREEMERTGAQEVLLPALQPADLWQQSGRYEIYGPELVRLHDRNGREFALGPTHEEVITQLVGQEISTYRKLPVTLFQLQTKFRDERRPRSGLLRCREFVMKDAYSFDSDWEGLDKTYQAMYEAYHRIFERCGLAFRAVHADAGAIGGEGGTHEFMAVAESGEDDVVTCDSCGYAANMEKAQSLSAAQFEAMNRGAERDAGTDSRQTAMEKFHTPRMKSIDDLVAGLGIAREELIKTLIYAADGKPVAVLVRGDHSINETKVMNALGAISLTLADADTVRAVTGAGTGFAGPAGLTIPLLVDVEVSRMRSGVAGANETDYHVRNVVPGRDFPLARTGDFRNIEVGDCCPSCENGKLQTTRGIEIGHVFKLGTKYSEKLGAQFVGADGETKPIIMGCYGIGVSRLLSAIIEQHHDENGMIWPSSVAPFDVHVIPVSLHDAQQVEAAERLYACLTDAGFDVLLDDRDERPGVKLKDSDLIGIPVRIVVGKGIADGEIEWKERSEGAAQRKAVSDVLHGVTAVLRDRS